MSLLPPGNIRLVLASRSPRRRKLLAEAGLDFQIMEKNFNESFPHLLEGQEIAEYLARSKALQAAENITEEGTVIVTADTIVWCNGRILGKPDSHESASAILDEISGKTHEVITGICLAMGGNYHVFSETTKVTFDVLTDDIINHYICRFRPYDKAGAYGIQEWIGIVGCRSIEGCFFNVVGMPVNRFLRELKIFLENNL